MWHGATRLWHSEEAALPTAQWAVLHLALGRATSAQPPGSMLNLALDGTPLVLGLPLPTSGGPAFAGAAGDASAWRLGVSARSLAFTDVQAVAGVRASCGDGPSAEVAFTVSADGWHTAPPPADGGDGARRSAFGFYAEPRLQSVYPTLGHLEGGSLLQVTRHRPRTE